MADQNEIKKLLDDPNVSKETKKQLVPALAGAGGSDADVDRYAKANGVEVPSDPGAGSHILGAVLAVPTLGISSAVVAGKEMKRSDWEKKGGEADKLVSQAKEQQHLGATQKVLNERGPFQNSNVLLEAGAAGLRFYEKFARCTRRPRRPVVIRPGPLTSTASGTSTSSFVTSTSGSSARTRTSSTR